MGRRMRAFRRGSYVAFRAMTVGITGLGAISSITSPGGSGALLHGLGMALLWVLGGIVMWAFVGLLIWFDAQIPEKRDPPKDRA